MPKKELDHPCLAARGTMATDMTTRSALQRHMTNAINATTLNLSGTLTFASSLPLLPISIPLSIPSAVHLTSHLFFCSFFCRNISSTLPPVFPPYLSDKHSHFTGFSWSLDSNPKLVLLKPTKLDLELKKHEGHVEDVVGAAIGEACLLARSL